MEKTTLKNRRAVLRLDLAVGIGVLGGILTPSGWSWQAQVLIGWCLFCLVNLGLLLRMWSATPEQTEAWAQHDDESRNWSGFVTSTAAVVSLVGVLFAMVEARASDPPNLWLVLLGVLTVALSWLLVQAEYALHYADYFYSDGKVGFTFRDQAGDAPTSDPDFRDFLYVALTVGMSYAISDTDVNTRQMRRRVMGHALLSYLFGSAIVAITINAVASFLG